MDFRHFLKILTAYALPLGRILRNECIRKTGKNGEKREKTADLDSLFGEMEHNRLLATCEHNYGATFLRSRARREHSIPH